MELATRAMQYSSRAGENVLDLFGGSGSTLIAAEQTGRRAFLMEIDALYADVIVDRYQRFSGKQAILERTGDSPIPMKPREENMRSARCLYADVIVQRWEKFTGRKAERRSASGGATRRVGRGKAAQPAK